jgi:hypothetical protein
MQDLIRNSQLYGFNNNSPIGKICVAKCVENGQIIIIQGIAMKNLCCVQYHRQENKT